MSEEDEEELGTDAKKTLPLGDYFVEWRRKSTELEVVDSDDDEAEEKESMTDKNLFNVLTKTKLPDVTIEKFPFQLETEMPAFGNLDQKLIISYRITNKTKAKILDIECSLEENEFFSISGNKLARKLEIKALFNDTISK